MLTCEHGGNLDRAISQFGGNRKEWIDLSTGINPYTYNVFDLSSDIWRELPDQQLIESAIHSAKIAYQAKSSCLPLAGVQQVIQLLPFIIKKKTKNVCILYPSYNEYEVQFQRANWNITRCQNVDEMKDANCAIIVNPNNPDGKKFLPNELLELSNTVGTLIIDESFCDLYPHLSVLPHLTEHHKNIIIFRSFGKFYGLAGLRLGFVFSCEKTINEFSYTLGKWAVSGPALAIGACALTDDSWRQQTLEKLEADALRLDKIAQQNGLESVGGTNLFRLYQCNNAKDIQHKLAKQRIWTRIFSYSEYWIRLGLPKEDGWDRLERAFRS